MNDTDQTSAARGGPVPERKPIRTPDLESTLRRVGSLESENSKPLKYVLGLVLAIPIAILALAAISLLLMPTWGPISAEVLEVKQMADATAALEQASADPEFAALAAEHPQAAGEALWALIVREKLVDRYTLSKLVSLGTRTDAKPDFEEFQSGQPLGDPWCSYTAPRADQLTELMQRNRENRVVLITFNARNWANYPDHGVIVVWTDGDVAEFLPFEYFEENYGITEEEWADPAGKLFGKKAPFQFTFE